MYFFVFSNKDNCNTTGNSLMSKFGPPTSSLCSPKDSGKSASLGGPTVHFFFSWMTVTACCLKQENCILFFTFPSWVVFMRVCFQKLQYRPESKLSALVSLTQMQLSIINTLLFNNFLRSDQLHKVSWRLPITYQCKFCS